MLGAAEVPQHTEHEAGGEGLRQCRSLLDIWSLISLIYTVILPVKVIGFKD